MRLSGLCLVDFLEIGDFPAAAETCILRLESPDKSIFRRIAVNAVRIQNHQIAVEGLGIGIAFIASFPKRQGIAGVVNGEGSGIRRKRPKFPGEKQGKKRNDNSRKWTVHGNT